MKQRLFGLRKAHINRLLKQMKIMFSSEFTQYELEFEKLKSENKLIESELKELAKQKTDQVEDLDVYNLGQERLEKVIHFLDERTETEIEELQKSYAERTKSMNQQIVKLEEETEAVEKLFSVLLNQLKVPMLFSQNDEIGVKSLDEVAASIDLSDLNADLEITSTEGGNSGHSLADIDTRLETENQKKGNSFWGDIEGWTTTSLTSFQEERIPDSNTLFDIDVEFDKKIIKKDDIPKQTASEESGEFRELKDSKELEIVDNIDGDPPSDALLEQIDSIKTQYIVGKVAGEDLYDQHGHVIVSKNSLITRETVERANRIGKLAELIVNMKLTGGVD